MAKAKARITSTKNAYGICIKKCCASCKHKYYNDNGTRMCAKSEKKVKALYKCRSWRMSKGMKNAGMSGGVVRDKDTKEVIIR